MDKVIKAEKRKWPRRWTKEQPYDLELLQAQIDALISRVDELTQKVLEQKR